MIRLGITGGIGAGKSVVSRLLRLSGVPVYDSDTRAKLLMVSHPGIREELIGLLGKEAYEGGRLNKPFLAAALFNNEALGGRINGIVHPRVKEDFREWVNLHNAFPVVGMESAILIEADFAEEVDRLLLVYAPAKERVRRVMERDRVSQELVLQRMSRQADEELKKKCADYIIHNYGNHPVIFQVQQLLLQLAES